MKNINKLFPLVVFLLFAMNASAQTVNVNWVDRIGQENVTVRITANNVPTSGAILRMFWGEMNFPSWWSFYGDFQLPPGNSSHDLTFNTQNMGISTGQSFDARYVFLDQSYNEIGTPGLLFQNVASFPPMYLTVEDWVGGFPPSATMGAHMYNGQYGVGRPSYYVTRIFCDIWDSLGTYSDYRMFTQPITTNILASFNLPPYGGKFCFVWSATDSDESLSSHFTNVEVFRSDTICFYWAGITTGECENLSKMEGELKTFPNPFVDDLKIETTQADDFSLFDIAGGLVSTGHLNEGLNSLWIPGLQPGTYIIRTDGGLSKRVTKE